MCKYFSVTLYSVFFLLPCISGCQLAHFAGGGGILYLPPEKIVCDKPWEIAIVFCVWPVDPKEKYGKLAERWKNVIVHIHNSSDSNFVAIPMAFEIADPNTGKSYFKANMKPISCNSGIKYVEYYIDEMFDEHYNVTRLYRAPVSKD